MRASPRRVLRGVRRMLRRTAGATPTGPVASRRAAVRSALEEPLARPSPRDPDTRAWVVAGSWLRAGLGWQWATTVPRPGEWRADVDVLPTVLLIEVADAAVPGWSGATDELADLVRTLTERGVAAIVWETGGATTPGPEPVVRHATVVAVTDGDRQAEWRELYPEVAVEVVGAAVEPRLAVPGGPAGRRLDAGVLPVRTDQAGAGPDAELRDVAARATTDVWWVGDTASGGGSARTVTADRLGALLGKYRACLTDDSWVVAAAGATQTPVVWPGEPPAELADVVTGVGQDESTRRLLTGRIHQGELADREGLRLYRAVLGSMTIEHRTAAILSAAGLPVPPRRTPSVSAVVPTNRAHEIDNVLDNLGRQRHDRLQLVLVLHGLDVPDDDLKARAAERGVRDLTVLRADPGLTLGSCMNLGVQAAEGDYVAKMDDDNYYGEFFLTDLLTAFDHTDAGIVGKWAHYVWLRSSGAVVLRYPKAEHTYERRIQGGSMLFDGAVVRELGFSDIPRAVDSDILDRAIAAGVRIYSGDRFNYVSVRGTDRTGHTWPVEDATFLTGAGSLVFYGDPRPHVSV